MTTAKSETSSCTSVKATKRAWLVRVAKELRKKTLDPLPFLPFPSSATPLTSSLKDQALLQKSLICWKCTRTNRTQSSLNSSITYCSTSKSSSQRNKLRQLQQKLTATSTILSCLPLKRTCSQNSRLWVPSMLLLASLKMCPLAFKMQKGGILTIKIRCFSATLWVRLS